MNLEKFYKEGDLKNYTIAVHALKSTSKMLGIMGLSEQARSLEMAAKEGDSGFIDANHARLMEDYTSITDGIRRVLEG